MLRRHDIDRDEIWRLYFDERISQREIGERLGIPQGTVFSTIYRRRKATGVKALRIKRYSKACKAGHPWTEASTLIERRGRGTPEQRRCKICRDAQNTTEGRRLAALHCTACGKKGHSHKTCPKLGVVPGVFSKTARCRCGLLLPCHSCVPTIREAAEARQGLEMPEAFAD